MAGFAVDIGDAGTAANRGIAAPSYRIYDAASEQGVALGKGLFSVLDAFADASKPPSQASIDDARYSNYVGKLQDLKGTPTDQMRAKVSSLYTSAISNGLKPNQAVVDATKALTGVDISHVNADPYLEVQNKVSEILSDKPQWTFVAVDSLKKDGNTNPTQEEIMTRTFNLIAQVESASLISANAATMGQAQWDASGQNNAILAIDTLQKVGVKALEIEIAGGNVDPKSLERLRAEYIKLKANFAKPAYVSTESYQGVQARLDGLNAIIGQIESYDANVLKNVKQGVITKIDEAIVKNIQASGDANPLAARALLANIDKVTEIFANKDLGAFTKILNDVKPEDIDYQSIDFSTVTAEAVASLEDDTTPSNVDPLFTLHNVEEIDKAKGRTNKDRLANIEQAMTTMVTALKPEAVYQEDARNLFLSGIDKVTLNVATSPSYAGDNILFNPKSGLFGKHTFDALKVIERLDPDAAKIARAQLKNALQAQATIKATEFSGKFADSIFRLTGVGTIDFKTETAKMPPAWTSGRVKEIAVKYYDGNVFNMLKDRGSKLETQEKTELRSKGFDVVQLSSQYGEVVSANETNKKLAEAYRKMGGKTKDYEALILDKQEGTATDGTITEETLPFEISAGLSEDEQKAAYDNLPSGALFIDPADGQVYRKP